MFKSTQDTDYSDIHKSLRHKRVYRHAYPLYSPAVIEQKIDYIHENPVKAGFVGAAHEYWYSSANVESPLKIIY